MAGAFACEHRATRMSGGSRNKIPSRGIRGACLTLCSRAITRPAVAGLRMRGDFMKLFVAMFCAVSLAGCAGSPVGDAIAGPEALAQRDDAYCKSIGTNLGTPEYANCRMLAEQNRANRHAASLGLAAAGAAAGAAYVASANQPVYAPAPAAPVRCRSVYVGTMLQTVCQ